MADRVEQRLTELRACLRHALEVELLIRQEIRAGEGSRPSLPVAPDGPEPVGSLTSPVDTAPPHPCMRCGSEEWTDVDYSGCSDCREPVEPLP